MGRAAQALDHRCPHWRPPDRGPGSCARSSCLSRARKRSNAAVAVDIILRAIIIYLLVFVFTRALGRRELATLQPFDLILLVVICDLIQSGVT
jgi:hypothetical protein